MKKVLILFVVICFSLPLFPITCPDPPDDVHPEQRPNLYHLKSKYKDIKKDKQIKPFKPEVNKMLAPEPTEDHKTIFIC